MFYFNMYLNQKLGKDRKLILELHFEHWNGPDVE